LMSIKMGAMMGGAVGGIFGTLTGLAQSVKTGNIFYLPVYAIGSAGAFGFFLGCGMIVRCDEDEVGNRRVVPVTMPGAAPAFVMMPQGVAPRVYDWRAVHLKHY